MRPVNQTSKTSSLHNFWNFDLHIHLMPSTVHRAQFDLFSNEKLTKLILLFFLNKTN